MSVDLCGKRIHFMGAGGIGMSALAELTAARGALVTGCDREDSENTERLRARGLGITIGHDPNHVTHADWLVYTSAIPPDHPELLAGARRALRRGTLLARLLEGYRAIGVCGTHGKTTTAWMIAHILSAAGRDPTAIIGGLIPSLDGNLRLGKSGLFVAELDESDGSFLEPKLEVAVITNVESDHLHHYASFDNVRRAFRTYAEQVAAEGVLVAGCDDPEAAAILAGHRGRKISCGFSAETELRAVDLEVKTGVQHFDVVKAGESLGRFTLSLPGKHNVQNALAALAVCLELEVSGESARAALATCPGVRGRLELLGEAGGLSVYNDYAHHPTEIRAAINGARDLHPGPLLVAFQPHLYSRTRDYAAEFGRALATAEATLVADIYPAREDPLPGVTAALVVDSVRRAGGDAAGPFSLAELPVEVVARAGGAAAASGAEAVICMGAGDIWKVGHEILAELSR